MSTRGALGWVIVAVALVAGYWFTGKLEVQRQRTAYDAKRFLEIEAESIQRIGITTREHELIEAERVGEGEWRMLAPYPHIPPNHELWTQFSMAIPLLINERTIEESPEDLAIYGLDAPPLKLTVEAGGEIIQLNVGKADPTQNNRYAQLGDGGVFLLPGRMAELFYQPLDNLRDTLVFSGMAEGMDRIQVQRFETENRIDEAYVLDDSGVWKMVEPQEAVVFQNELLYLVNDLSFLRGAHYVDDPDSLGDFGLEPGWARIAVSNSETGENKAMVLGWLDDMADDGRMFATVEGVPSVFTIDAAFIDKLPDEAGDYRERRLFTGEATQLTSIHFQNRSRTFTLVNDEAKGWRLIDPAVDDTDNVLVSRFISIMKQFSGSRFPGDGETEFGEERIRYSFEYADGTKTYFAILGPVPDSDPIQFYVRQDVGTVITIPAEAVDVFSPKPFTFRNRQIFAFNPLTALRISVTVDGVRRTLVQKDKNFSVLEPAKHGFASQADLVSILQTMPALLALDVDEGELDEATLGFENPVLEAEVEWVTEDGQLRTGHLWIGNLIAVESRRRFAKVEGRPEVFYVDHGYIEDLREGLKGIVPSP